MTLDLHRRKPPEGLIEPGKGQPREATAEYLLLL